jgi:hypothetical protein
MPVGARGIARPPDRSAVLGLAAVALVIAGVLPGPAAALGPRAAVTARRGASPDSAGGEPSFLQFLDPDPHVVCKEFAFFYNTVPDSTAGSSGTRGLFHLVYQRSGGPQAAETTFGHAWSTDLRNWTVDTLAFSVDATPWNAQHVWSPSLVHHGSRDYLFYTGVDAASDQRIGYASTALLDTTDTVWDPARVMVLEAERTRWAVPDPWTYGFQTQFRDAYVLDDPEHPGQLLMFYDAHDSLDFKANRGGLAVGVARSDPGTVDTWQDLGYYPSTLPRVTQVGQLEGPHVFSANGTGTSWRLMFSNGGSPPGEHGQSTIRFETLAPGASLADTTPANWSAPVVLKQYLDGDTTVFGWSGSEELRAVGVDYLAGFTAWGPYVTAIAYVALIWNGDEFTLTQPAVTAVDAVHSAARGVRMGLAGYTPRGRVVTFVVESPLELDARLEVFDTLGRRLRTLFAGTLRRGTMSVSWDLSSGDGGRLGSGVYFARLAFAGGARAVSIPVVR